MTVSRVQLATVEAKRYAKQGERHPQVRIDHNSTVTKVEMSGDDTATVEFRYTASYGSLGTIKLEGDLVYEGKAKALADQWNENGQMPGDIASEIHTAVMRVCVTEAVGLAKDLQLPPPIPLPQVQVQDQGQGKGQTKGGGPEVA